MNKLRILVSGKNGQISSEIVNMIDKFPLYEFQILSSSQWDITDKNQSISVFENFKPNFYINCSAYTAVDLAETEKKSAFELNANCLIHLSELCNKYDTHFIHFSTDFVFDGMSNIPYSEDDKPNPLSVYGKSKLDGENNIIQYSHSFNIFRTSWVYSIYGKNFVKTISNLAKNRPQLNIIYDQVGTPTHAYDIAKFVLENLQTIIENKNKIYHFSNEGIASWYDFALEIVNIQGLNCEVLPINTSQYPTPAKRPHFSIMSKDKLKNDFNIKLNHWKKSLNYYFSLHD